MLEQQLKYWKEVADDYRLQRDEAVARVRFLENKLLKATGKAYDGKDYLRDILATKKDASFVHQIKHFFARYL